MGAAGDGRAIFSSVHCESMPDEGHACLRKAAFFKAKGPNPQSWGKPS